MATQISHDIWTMKDPDVVFAGASMHTRMTVVRLQDGHLWIHSPFHKSSRSLIFTDLMINLKPDGIKLIPRLFLQFEGIENSNI